MRDNPLRAGGEMPAQVWNIAHRGARAFAPENTLYSFAKAKTFDCPMVEVDVHRSKDGELMVHHDDQLMISPMLLIDIRGDRAITFLTLPARNCNN